MFIKSLQVSFVSLCTYLASCALAGAAGVSYDFNAGLPAGTSVAGGAVWSATDGIGNSGCVKITVNANGAVGGFTIPDINGGLAVTNFRVKFKLLIGGGTDRPADGGSFNFANNIGTATPGEDGTGSGITITFDTWDNNTPDTAPAIELKYGGSVIAFQSMDVVSGTGTPLREGGRAPDGPILTNAAGGNVSLETTPPASTGIPPTNFVDFVINLFSDNTVSVSFSNVVVFNHVAIPYVPIAGGSWVWGARTGGANDNHWLDNVEIAVNYTPGPAIITTGPTDQTVTESQTATFSAQVQGTPPYSIQWFSNAPMATPVAIPGANFLSYTTPATTLAMNGLHYHVEVSGAESITPAVSEDAVLHVNAGVVAQSAGSRLNTNKVFVTYSKPVTLNGTYTLDNGATVGTVAYGSSHNEIVLTTSQLVPGTRYCLQINNVHGEDSSNLIPDPTTLCFNHGVGGFCTDFSGLLPANVTLRGAAATNALDGSLHLHEALNGVGGAMVYSGYSSSLDRIHITCNALIGNTNNIGTGADGVSFSLAGDIPLGETGLCDPYCAENGVGTGLSVTIDTWDDGSLYDPSIDIIWKGATVAHRYFDRPNGEQLERDHFVPLVIHLDPNGKMYVLYDSITVFTNVQLPNFDQIANPQFGIFSRTGGQNENSYIDDLCVSHAYNLGPVSIVTQPADVSVFETFRATFQVVLDGSPTYNIQWYSNNVAIPGATGLTYTTPPLGTNANGALYKATIDNGQGPVTTRDALLTVAPGVLVLSANAPKEANKIYVEYNKTVNLNGTYTVNNGVIVNTKAYGSSHSEVILSLAAPLTPDTTYTITIAGVTAEDSSPLVPDPTIGSFRFGYGAFCTDFSPDDTPTIPPGTSVIGNGVSSGYISNGVFHLTDQVGNLTGALLISNRTAGAALDRLDVTFNMKLNNQGALAPADGVSFNWGSDVLGASSEEGLGTGLIVVFDTWSNDATQPRFALKWKGAQVATVGPIPFATLVQGNFVPVRIAMDPDGTVDLWYNNNQIFNNFQLPNFAPIANSAFSFSARTGGAFEDAWLDNLCINNFTLGPAAFTLEPVDTTTGETLPATFTAVAIGTGPLHYQWMTNGVPVPGANLTSYTTPPATEQMEGLHVSVQVSNSFSVVTSSNATLHVTLNPRLVNAFICAPDKLVVSYTRPVELDDGLNNVGSYTLNNGAGAESFRAYGATHKDVIVTFDSPFVENTIYTLTIQDVMNEAGDTLIAPNPTLRSFRYGYSRVNTNFNGIASPTIAPAAIGNDMTIYGTSYVSNGVLHITDDVTGQAGGVVATNINGGAAVDRFVIRYRATLVSAGNPADGYSVNIAPNLPTSGSEEGVGTGLTVAFDNFDNGGGEAPAIDIKWNQALIRTTTNAAFADTFKSPATITSIIRTPNTSTYKDVYIDLEPNGKLYLTYDGVTIYNGLQTPFTGSMANANVGIYGRVGGLFENCWIDDLQINNEGLGAPTVIKQPVGVTVNEPGTATFKVDADGFPPFTYQWYSNNVAIAGATNTDYTTPLLFRGAEGAAYKAVVTGPCGTATSSDAIVHVNQDNIAPSVLWISTDNTRTNLLLFWSETPSTATGNSPGNYSINNGVSVMTAAYIPSTANRYVTLTTSTPLNPANCNILTVNGVNDLSGFNPVNNARYPIVVTAGFATVGSSNFVVIEAEDFDVNRSPGIVTLNNSWVLATTLPGYVGRGYMDATPNIGAGSGDNAATLGGGTSMDYAVNFGAAGTYYIFARGSTANDGGNNSFQMNVDGVSQGTQARQIGNGYPNWGGDGAAVNKFGWVNHANAAPGTRAQVTIATPGIHLLTVVMREDGLKLDRFFLTTDANAFLGLTNQANNATFQDPGPAATIKTDAQQLKIVRDVPGNAQISWFGAGWLPQASAGLSNNPAQTIWVDLRDNSVNHNPLPSPITIPVGFFPTGTNVFFRLKCPN